MKIYKDGGLDAIEKIVLSEYKTQDDMHQLFREKGFEQFSEEEMQAFFDDRQKKEDEAAFERKREMQKRKKEYKETYEKLRYV